MPFQIIYKTHLLVSTSIVSYQLFLSDHDTPPLPLFGGLFLFLAILYRRCAIRDYRACMYIVHMCPPFFHQLIYGLSNALDLWSLLHDLCSYVLSSALSNNLSFFVVVCKPTRGSKTRRTKFVTK